MQTAIEQALAVLVGLPLWAAGRAADLHWFHFGAQREQVDRRGRARTVGTYALHIQCPWHLAASTGILVASADRTFAAGDDPYTFEDDDTWDWDVQGANRCDERLANFFTVYATMPPMVLACTADPAGGARISLSDGIVLALFPADSLDREHWRLFQPGTGNHHFVITGSGIED